MNIEKSPLKEGEEVKFERKEIKEKVKETLSAIRESIEEARKLREENPENRIPRLIWGRRRLEENHPDYEKNVLILERVFKKLGVDMTKKVVKTFINLSLEQKNGKDGLKKKSPCLEKENRLAQKCGRQMKRELF